MEKKGEEETASAINPMKLANAEASRDRNGSKTSEMTVQKSLGEDRAISKRRGLRVSVCARMCCVCLMCSPPENLIYGGHYCLMVGVYDVMMRF